MIEDCLFCDAFMCDICVHHEVGNADASLGLDDDGFLYYQLLGVELSSERERGEPEFDPW